MVSIVASVWCSAKPRPHGAGGADTLYHPLHQCYTKYYVILFAKIRPTTMETQYHMKREMSDITGLQYTRLNTIDRPFSISFYELFLQTSGDCTNLPKISFNQSIILFCFNGAHQCICMALGLKRLIQLDVNIAYVLERSDNTFDSPTAPEAPIHHTIRYTSVTLNSMQYFLCKIYLHRWKHNIIWDGKWVI
jgi:hypothetical protein